MKTLPFGNVKITDTKFCKDIKNNDEFMDSLDMDKLLFAYYTNTDICPKASSPYGGWENINFDDEGYSHISGHTLGHMLSAMSQRFASEGKFGDKIDYAVDELAKCQSENGYINTKPEKVIEDLEEDRTGANHYYSMHKHLAGLFDTYRYAGSKKALGILLRYADWQYSRIKNLSDEKREKMLEKEYGGMNELLFNIYSVSKDENHKKAAYAFCQKGLFGALERNEDVLCGNHANTMIPKIVGAARGYTVTGDKSLLAVAENFWSMVVERGRTFPTGGNAESEHFYKPGFLDRQIYDEAHETCNVYNMLKLTEILFECTGEKKYADYYEKAVFNAISGSINEKGLKTYFQFSGFNARKIFHSPFASFWCCTGTGMESFSKLNKNIYFSEGEELYVNSFISSECVFPLSGEQAQIKLSDLYEASEIEVTADKPFILKVRNPGWSDNTEVLVNGQRTANEKNGYFEIFIKEGKTFIRIDFSVRLKFEKLENETYYFTYGKKVYTAIGNRYEKLNNLAVDFFADKIDFEKDIKVIKRQNREFIAEINGEKLYLKPYDAVTEETHNMYFVLRKDKKYPEYSIAMHAKASSSKDADENMPSEQNCWLIRGLTPNLYLVHDGGEPTNSYGMQDEKYHVHKWGRFDHYSMGSGYIRYDFEKEETISFAEIYWADNTDEPHGAFKGNDTLPEKCVAEILLNGKIIFRKELENIEKDKYNKIEFPKMKADGMRLKLKAKTDHSIGILEWKVI